MSFIQRLGYFIFGVGLGSMLVYVLLIRDREFPAWLPEDRVIEELTTDTIFVAKAVVINFSDSTLKQKVKEADVLFRESIVRNEPCREYQLETDNERMRFSICKDRTELIQFDPK
ncbi:MAG: hypothetical protein RL266_1935 [Bacteroidota bacterium]|jgi:hypothetical protein